MDTSRFRVSLSSGPRIGSLQLKSSQGSTDDPFQRACVRACLRGIKIKWEFTNFINYNNRDQSPQTILCVDSARSLLA